jgi:hypothetical protein
MTQRIEKTKNIAFGFEPQKDKTHRRQCKMSSSKKLTCKGTFWQVFICLRPCMPYTPPPLTHCKSVYSTYTYSDRKGRGGGRVEPEKRLEGQQFTKLGREHQHDWLCLQSINLHKHLQSPFTGKKKILDEDILLRLRSGIIGALTKWLASRCQSECFGRLLYSDPSSTVLILYMDLV